jgi:predicted nicotinamide N-methyase
LNKGRKIPFLRTGWDDKDTGLGRFDLVIGSDLLYETDHVDLLSGFIDQHTQPQCEVLLVDPGRGYHARFSKKMIALGYSHSQSCPSTAAYLTKPFKGRLLRYLR